MLFAERQRSHNVSGKIGHTDYQYGMSGGGTLGNFGGGGGGGFVVNSRAFANSPYTSRPPFAVDDEPARVRNPYGKMTYWGLVKPGDGGPPAAGIRTGGTQSSSLVVGGGGGDGSVGLNLLSSRSPSSKLVSSDMSPLPPPAPGVYQNKPPLLFHSPHCGSLVVSPLTGPPVLNYLGTGGSGSGRSVSPHLGGGGGGGMGGASRPSSASGRPASSSWAATAAATTSVTSPPRAVSVPTNGQTFNIFYSDGLTEKDQLLRRKMDEYARALDLQQANAAQMRQHEIEKAERERRKKELELEEEERTRRERERIAQREREELEREKQTIASKIAAAAGGGAAVGPAPILVKTPKKKREDNAAESKGKEETSSTALTPLDRSWLSQPIPLLPPKKETVIVSSRPTSSLPAYTAPRMDLKPIALDLGPRTGGAPPTVSLPTSTRVVGPSVSIPPAGSSPPRCSRSWTGHSSPFDPSNQLQSTLQRISRDQEKIVDLLERQTNLSGRTQVSPRGVGPATSNPYPLGSGRRSGPRGAGTYLTEGLRMPAGQTGMSSLLSAQHPTHDASGVTTTSKTVGVSSLFPTQKRTTTTTTTLTGNTFLSDPLKAPNIFSTNSLSSGSGVPLQPLQPLQPLSSLPEMGKNIPSPSPNLMPPTGLTTAKFDSLTNNNNNSNSIINNNGDKVGAGLPTSTSYVRADSSIKLGGTLNGMRTMGGTWNAAASPVRGAADPDDLSIEPSKFIGPGRVNSESM